MPPPPGAYPYYDRDGNEYFFDLNNAVDSLAFKQLWSDENRVVKQTHLGDVMVSTICLIVDHRFDKQDGQPIIFETMVFGYAPRRTIWDRLRGRKFDDDREYQWRYTTADEAKTHHDLLVRRIRRGVGRL